MSNRILSISTVSIRKPLKKWFCAQHAAWLLAATASAVLLSPAPASAVLVVWDNGGVGTNYATALNWSGDVVPSAADDAQVNNAFTVTYDATTGDRTALSFFIGDRTSPYGTTVVNFSGDDTFTVDSYTMGLGNATTNHSGATLHVNDNLTVGTEFSTNRSTTALYNHSGGLVDVDDDLIIATQSATNTDPTQGTYQVSGTAQLDVEGRVSTAVSTFADNTGRFRITGSDASIDVGSYAQTSRGTLTFVMDAAGVTAIDVASTAAPNGDGSVTLGGTLQVDLTSLDPNYPSSIVLIDNDLLDAISGTFSTITGLNGTNWDGGTSTFSFNDLDFMLSYNFDSATNTDGAGNDLALVNLNAVSIVPEPASLALLGLGLVVFAPRLTRKLRARAGN